MKRIIVVLACLLIAVLPLAAQTNCDTEFQWCIQDCSDFGYPNGCFGRCAQAYRFCAVNGGYCIFNLDPEGYSDPIYGCWHLLPENDTTILSIEWNVANTHAFVEELRTQPEGFIERFIAYRRELQPLYETRMLTPRSQRSPCYCEVGKHESTPFDMYCIDFDVLCCREHYRELIEKHKIAWIRTEPRSEETKPLDSSSDSANTDINLSAFD